MTLEDNITHRIKNMDDQPHTSRQRLIWNTLQIKLFYK